MLSALLLHIGEATCLKIACSDPFTSLINTEILWFQIVSELLISGTFAYNRTMLKFYYFLQTNFQ